MRIAIALGVCLIVGGPTLASDTAPCGPELAKPAIGVLLKAYPMQTASSQISAKTWVALWGCIYKVGVAEITLTRSTGEDDPMPCKRKAAFN